VKKNGILRRWEFWGAWCSIFGLVLTIGIFVYQLRKDIKSVQVDIERVEEKIERSQFRVNYPMDGGVVEMTDVVKGWSPHYNKIIYVVITPVETGDDFIQGNPAIIYTGGFWTSRAIFGTAAVGAGQKFLIRAIATEEKLPPGLLTHVPADAIFSEGVYVMRKK